MIPSSCEFEPELSAYLDDELAAETRARLDAHLSHCRPCAVELQRLRHTSAVLRRWDAHETAYAASTGFRNRVATQVEALGVVDPLPVREPLANSQTSQPQGRSAFAMLRHPLVAASLAASITAAVAWSAFGPAATPRTDLAGLASRVDQVRQELDARLAAVPAVALAPPSPFAVDRLAPLGSEVSGDVASGPSLPQAPSELWEPLEEGMLLQDARAAWDEFGAERRRLTFEERIAQRVADAGNGTRGAPTPPVAVPVVSSWIGALRLAEPRPLQLDRVYLWPIEAEPLAKDAVKAARPLSADDAVRLRVLRVREDEQGNVVATNDDAKRRSVLLLAGDVLHGGRRDRVLRDDVLLAPGRSLLVRAFGSGRALERTSYRSFVNIPMLAPVELRAVFGADALGSPVVQSDVDDVVAASVTRLGSPKGQGSLYNLSSNADLQRELDRYADAFRKRLEKPNVVGFAVAVGPRLLGVEVAGDAASFQALRDRALRSHLLTALALPSSRTDGPPPSETDVTSFLQQARLAVYDDPGAAGDALVSSFRTVDGSVFGYGLIDGGRVIHAVVFNGIPGGSVGNGGRGGARRPDGTTTGPPAGTAQEPPPDPRTPEPRPEGAGVETER